MPAADSSASLADVTLLADAARAAGDIALGYFRRDPKVFTKTDQSPVTEADLAVDAYLRETLQAARPGHGWLSEETADTADRLSRQRVFVVDPIDGTRAFIAGGDEWVVSIAIVEDGRPVAGVLFRPVTGGLYAATRGGGARFDGQLIAAAERSDLAGARFAGPRPIGKDPRLSGIDPVGFIPSLALRLAYVADGRIDAAAAREKAKDWDLAAADLILSEAGGRLTDYSGALARYNRTELAHPALIASGDRLHPVLLDRLAQTG